MTTMIHSMAQELAQEAATTRRLLERVPEDRLGWAPHPKSMTLGQLALHVATIPGDLSGMAQLPEFDAVNANFDPPAPERKQQLLEVLDTSVAKAAAYFAQLTPESAGEFWKLTLRGNEVFSIPRIGLLRSILLNHWYHHRGQLSVYLRLLDVPVPVIYGRSADENPFA